MGKIQWKKDYGGTQIMWRYTWRQRRQIRKWGYYLTKENGVWWRNYPCIQEE